MCGRFLISEERQAALRERMRNKPLMPDADFPIITGEVFPTNGAYIVAKDLDGEFLTPCVWGFPPYKGNNVIINARAETVAEKYTFSDSFFNRRALLPVDGFYEWTHTKPKIKYLFTAEQPMFLAVIYRLYPDAPRFVILTVAANRWMQDTHDRMPVILSGSDAEIWLGDPLYAASDNVKERVLIKNRADG